MKKTIILLSSLLVLCSCNNKLNNRIDNCNNKVYVNTSSRAIIGFENNLIYFRNSNYNFIYTYSEEYTKNDITYYTYIKNNKGLAEKDSYLYFTDDETVNFYCLSYEYQFLLDKENIYTLNDCKKVL